MSENLLLTKCLLCLASFMTGLTYIIVTKVSRRCKNDETPICWSQPDYDTDGSGAAIPGTYRVRKRIVSILMLRGMLEFSGSLLLLLSFKLALEHSVNQGICSAMVTIAGLMIAVLSFCIYGERLNLVQGLGMATILIAICLMGFTQEITAD